VVKAAGYDLIIAETAGIGQGDSNIVNLSDLSLYVMTSEFGAASQLEKIDMLDYADMVVVNKFEKRGSEDAVRDVRKQVQRNRGQWETAPKDMPVFGTIASKFNDDGVTALYHAIIEAIQTKTGVRMESRLEKPAGTTSSSKTIIIPPDRDPLSDGNRRYHPRLCTVRLKSQSRYAAEDMAVGKSAKSPGMHRIRDDKGFGKAGSFEAGARQMQVRSGSRTPTACRMAGHIQEILKADEFVYNVRDKEYPRAAFREIPCPHK
jgi:methylmalonyl-CoA mutase